MALAKEAERIIRMLTEGGFYAECPCCGEPILLKNAGLFYRDDFTPEAERLYQSVIKELKERKKGIHEMKKQFGQTSETGAKSSKTGKILERICPSFKTFPYERNDCRSLFDPIDYVIFQGLTKNRVVDEIIFADVKTGKGDLTGKQPEIRDLIKRKRVAFETYECGK